MNDYLRSMKNATEIRGIADDCPYSIDADQAVDETGKVIYKEYCIMVGDEEYFFTAEQMEEHAT